MPLLDQDLPARAQQGDENALAALIARMMPAIRKGAAECTAPGLDFDDAVQEGLIGLFHAVRGFDPATGQTFTAYAAACIRHAQQDARRAALRKKHAPLNYSVPLPAAEESTDTRPGPEELAIFGEQYADDAPPYADRAFRAGTHGFNGRAGRPHPRADRAGAADFPPKTWPMRWPVRAASCAVRPQPRIQAICLRHISTCPQ